MQKFELVLKNERVNSYKKLFLLFILLNLGFILAIAVTAGSRRAWATAGTCLVLSASAFAAEQFLKKRNKPYNGKAAAIVFIIIAFFNYRLWWAAIAALVLSLLYAVSVRRLIARVNATEVVYPSFPPKQLAWSDLNNIILKDGILTIDRKNNKIAQAEVINGENDYDVDEKEFNDFCQVHLRNQDAAQTIL